MTDILDTVKAALDAHDAKECECFRCSMSMCAIGSEPDCEDWTRFLVAEVERLLEEIGPPSDYEAMMEHHRATEAENTTLRQRHAELEAENARLRERWAWVRRVLPATALKVIDDELLAGKAALEGDHE